MHFVVSLNFKPTRLTRTVAAFFSCIPLGLWNRWNASCLPKQKEKSVLIYLIANSLHHNPSTKSNVSRVENQVQKRTKTCVRIGWAWPSKASILGLRLIHLDPFASISLIFEGEVPHFFRKKNTRVTFSRCFAWRKTSGSRCFAFWLGDPIEGTVGTPYISQDITGIRPKRSRKWIPALCQNTVPKKNHQTSWCIMVNHQFYSILFLKLQFWRTKNDYLPKLSKTANSHADLFLAGPLQGQQNPLCHTLHFRGALAWD